MGRRRYRQTNGRDAQNIHTWRHIFWNYIWSKKNEKTSTLSWGLLESLLVITLPHLRPGRGRDSLKVCSKFVKIFDIYLESREGEGGRILVSLLTDQGHVPGLFYKPLCYWFSHWLTLFLQIFTPKALKLESRQCHISCVCVTCHMSNFICHMSYVTC